MRNRHKKSDELTPKQLADKLRVVMNRVIELSKSDAPENEWAKKAVEDYKEYRTIERFMPREGVFIPAIALEEYCPELYSKLLDLALKIAAESNAKYEPIKPPEYVLLSEYNNMGIIPINNGTCDFMLGLPYLAEQKTMADAVAVTSHEFGHSYQHAYDLLPDKPPPSPFSRYNSPKIPYDIEFNADRSAKPMEMIASLLPSLIRPENKYKYYEDERTHPSTKNRIRVLLEQEMANGIFGMHGSWAKRKGVYHFKPDGLTESGHAVANWSILRDASEQKASELVAELTQKLDSGFDGSKKDKWLKHARAEVAKFKEEHKPELVTPQLSASGSLQLHAPSHQRGGIIRF